MNDLQIINISGIDCYEKDGTAYLKLETVARGLGFTEIARSGNECVRWRTVKKYLAEFGIATSCDGAKNGAESGGLPDFIPENVFYRLAMKAKNEAAERFQAKIADEVIPTIRRTGGYVGNEQKFVDTYLPYADEHTRELFSSTLAALREANAKIEADRPKVLFADAVSTAKTSILVGELAKLLKQNGVPIGQNRLFTWLRDNGYLICRNGTDYNMPTQKSMEMGLFEIKETAISHSDGHTSINKTPKVTGKGQQYFVEKFLGDDA